ncbi:MAG: prepilin-type N-terminal cleavage/methylation domain-containing protein [Candidatus Omnitrophota bacterium]
MKQFNNVKGFSIVEVAIAVALLALIFSGMLEIFARGFSAMRKSNQRTIAYSLVRRIAEVYSDWNRLDTLDAGTPGVVTNGVYTDDPAEPAAADTLNPVTINGIVYTPNLTISNGSVYPTELKQIAVNVSFAAYTYTITTLKGNY